MSNLSRTKVRRVTTETMPSSLSLGEVVFNTDTKELFIGSINGVDKVSKDDFELIDSKIHDVDLQKASKLELEVERKRIDSFVALPQGSTQGDAELIDARVGANGIVYDSLGSSIRSQYLEKIALNRLNPSISKNFEKEYKSVEYIIKKGGYYDKDYVFHPSEDSKYTIINVEEDEEYHIKVQKNWIQPAYIILKDNTPVFIEPSETQNGIVESNLLIPYGCNKLIIQWREIYFINKVDSCVPHNINNTQLEDNLISFSKLGKNIQEVFDVSYRNIDNLKWISGSYVDINGNILNLTNYSYTTIPVCEGENFIISGKHRYSAVCYLVKDVTGKVLLTDEILDTNSVVDVLDKSFTIPKGGSTLLVNNYISDFQYLRIKDRVNLKYNEQSIPLSAFEPKLQEFYTVSYRDIKNPNWVDNFYITSTGSIVPMEGYGYAMLPVTEGTDIIISGSKVWQSICYLVKDMYGNVLLHDNRPSNATTIINDETFKIPKGGVQLYIGKQGFKELKIKDSVYLNFKDNSIPFKSLSNELRDNFKLCFRDVDKIEWVQKHYITQDGVITPIEDSSYSYTKISVLPGEEYRITGQKVWSSSCYVVKDARGNVVLHDNKPSGAKTDVVNEIFTIPSDGVELYVGGRGFKYLEKKSELINSRITSNLRDKLIVFNGDSICQGIVNGGGYAEILRKTTGCLIENRAIGGGTLAINKANKHMICNDIVNMNDNADLVILEGGINDYWQNIPMGEMKPLNDFTSEVDKETVLGALESIFRTCMDKWLGVPIMFIIVHPIANTRYQQNSVGYTFEQLAEGIRKMCKKYSIATVNLLDESGGFNGNVEKIAKKYTINGGDGCHPNEEGYTKYYVPQIRTKAESLIPR